MQQQEVLKTEFVSIRWVTLRQQVQLQSAQNLFHGNVCNLKCKIVFAYHIGS